MSEPEVQQKVCRRFIQLVSERDAQAQGSRPAEQYAYEFLRVRIEPDDWTDQPDYQCTVGNAAHNANKNRWRDVVPYDRTRVKLKEGSPAADGYINASHVNGEDESISNRYIASQAPLSCTLADFWQMVDEQQVDDIVMLCKLTENSKVKCDRYWPEIVGSSMTFGDKYVVGLQAQNKDTESSLAIRQLTLRRTADKPGSERVVRQYQYSDWPDYGRPQELRPIQRLLQLLHERRRDTSPDKRPPILMHCSAGCGRTGAIMAIDIVWQQLLNSRLPAQLDIVALILSLRRQRPACVQSLDQYVLVYHVIADMFKQHLTDAGVDWSTPLPDDQPAGSQSKSHKKQASPAEVATKELGSLKIPEFPAAVASKISEAPDLPAQWKREATQFKAPDGKF